MKRTLISSIFLFVFAFACFAADVTGNWKGVVKIPNRTIDVTYKLKSEGEKLTGSAISSYGEIPILDGKINGNDFTFKLEIGDDIVEQQGKLYGDSMVLVGNFRGLDIQSTFNRVIQK